MPWVITEEEGVPASCHSELVTGDAAQRDAHTTISLRTLIVYAAVLPAQVLLLWSSQAILRPWVLLPTSVWVLVQWQALLARRHTVPVPMLSDLGLPSLGHHQANLVRWVLRQVAFLPWVA
jgi:hypothetical protein